MENNENLAVEQIAENVEQPTEESPKTYTEAEFNAKVDEGAILAVVKAAIAANPAAVADYKSGKEKAIMALFGACMKQLKGNCDPNTLKEILIAEINKI